VHVDQVKETRILEGRY